MAPSNQKIAEAKEFIRELRWERGAENNQEQDRRNEFTVTRLDKLLQVVSHDLYTTPTHFLLELVQNADDNTYEAKKTPLLRLKMDDHYLQIDCNENGFSKDNISAICDIGQSTKSLSMKAKGYIGEKGLGFKSVFKVAETVWISSEPYQFKFEKSQRLGMITPIWEEMPARFKNNCTQILLQITSKDNIRLVQKELEAFDSSVVIFLRKLRKIELVLSNKVVTISKSLAQKFYGDALNLETTNGNQDSSQKDLQSYLLERYIIENMPDEKKRPNISESEVVLAFPFSLSGEEPIIKNQRVHNFLPIGYYGFNFLIQADFLLTANRQSIHDEPAWNTCLVSGIASAFAQAVHRFNRAKAFRYKWPMYLPQYDAGSGSILKNLREQILHILASTDCLEAQDGSFASPTRLSTVPSLYYDSSGNFLLKEVNPGASFLSKSYVPAVVWQFKIREYGSANFVQDLLKFSRDKFSKFSEMTPTWHSALCKALYNCPGQLENIKRIPLIPLRDGSWITAASKNIYFDGENGSELKIPNGLEVSIIEPTASLDVDRRKLFEHIGVKRLDKNQICQLILEQHRLMGQKSAISWPLSYFVEHAYYLYRVSRDINIFDLKRLQLVDHRKKLAEGKDLYLEAPSLGFRISEHFDEGNELIRLLHPHYFTIEGLNLRDWVTWLHHSLEIATGLRILNSFSSPTAELYWLIDNRPNECLKLMRDRSDVDLSFLGTHGHKFRNRMKVKCLDGKEDLISNVFLARSSITKIKSSSEMLSFIDLPDPEHDGWLKFRRIGLGVELDLKFYLEYLKNMHSKKCFVKEAKEIYEEIEKHYRENGALVGQIFRDFKVIFIGKTTKSPSAWVNLSECRWHAPKSLTKVFALAERYPSCKTLFTTHLSLKDATTDDIITELLALENNLDKIDLIQILLVDLATSLKSKKLTDPQYNRLNGAKIFPTYKEEKQLSTRGEPWFIVDRSGLEKCFKGRLLLLDVEPSGIRRLQPLLEALGVFDWTLSGKVTETLLIKGDVVLNSVLTQNLSSKAKFFASLVSEGTRSQVLSSFEKMKVFATTKIVVERKCLIKTKISEYHVQGEDDEGDVVLLEKDGQLQIYFSVRDVRSGDLPWADLAGKFCQFCEIDKSSMEKLVLKILTTAGHHRIKAILEENDFHVDSLFKKPKPFALGKSEVQEAEDEIEDVEMEDNFGDHDMTIEQIPGLTVQTINPPRAVNQNGQTSMQNAETIDLEEDDPIVSDEVIIQAAKSAQFDNNMSSSTALFKNSSKSPKRPRSSTISGQESTVRSLRSRNVHFNTGTAFKDADTPNKAAETFHSSSSQSTAKHSSENGPMAPPVNNPSNQADGSVDSSSHSSYSLNANRLVGMLLPTSGDHDSTRQLAMPRTEKELERDQRIGYLGELLMFKVFQEQLGEQEFTSESWTSTNRNKAGFSQFTEPEIEYSDFTFVDNIGNFGEKFQLPLNTARVTLHIEIKSTIGSNAEEPFHMSYNQQRLARRWSLSRPSETPKLDIYMVVRVYSLVDVPQYRIYIDPWNLFMRDELIFQPEGSFLVFPTLTTNYTSPAAGSNGLLQVNAVNPVTGQTFAGMNENHPIVVDDNDDEEL